ncbi:ParB N-terminal domain-containing protein, partial [Bradyrhizobium sp. 61]|uniref:ParB N-terminal domain-containing protein n=1 Tax=Bradyrhizobium sp. 61 TaxID=2782679 RepID=UPI001FF89B4E
MKSRRKIESIPIAAIKVLNPRNRSRARFKEIVQSIETVGLKRPITASKREMANGYELACGQTRSALGARKLRYRRALAIKRFGGAVMRQYVGLDV